VNTSPPRRQRRRPPRLSRPASRPGSSGLCACARAPSDENISEARPWRHGRAGRSAVGAACRCRDVRVRARADAPHGARCRGFLPWKSTAINTEASDSMSSETRPGVACITRVEQCKSERLESVRLRGCTCRHRACQGSMPQRGGAYRAPPTKGGVRGGTPPASIVVSLAGAGARQAGGMGQAGSVPRPSQLCLTDRWPVRELASDPNLPQRPACQPLAARWASEANPGHFLWAPMID